MLEILERLSEGKGRRDDLEKLATLADYIRRASLRVRDNCIGCTLCAQACPSGAIAWRPYERHEIDDHLCTRCDFVDRLIRILRRN